MAGYYKQGMTEAEQRALSATLSPEIRAQLLAAGLAQLPKCRSPDLDKCANLQSTMPGIDCQALADGWTGDYDKMEAAYDALPDCAPAKKSWSLGEMAAGTAVVLAIVVVLAKAARKTTATGKPARSRK